MTDEISVKPSHIIITVSDCKRAIAFYTKALGFTLRHEREEEVTFEPVLQLHDVKFREAFLTLGNLMIALFAFDRPRCIPASDHVANRLGIKQICFEVPDIDAAAKRVAAYGGNVLEHTRSLMPQAELLLVTDPDGTPLELVRRTD